MAKLLRGNDGNVELRKMELILYIIYYTKILSHPSYKTIISLLSYLSLFKISVQMKIAVLNMIFIQSILITS